MVLVKNVKLFPVFILVKIGQENVLDDILEWIKTFLDYENTKLKKSKNWDFSKGVSLWFWLKKYNFCYLLILGKISRENVF